MSDGKGHTDDPLITRRDLPSWIAAFLSVAAAAGSAGLMGVRYLYPNRQKAVRQIFVTTLAELPPGKAMPFTLPNGQKMIVNNMDGKFTALSDVCPHLGCRVEWQGAENRYFCPCHNGVFDATGKATGGPPAAEGKNMKSFRIATNDQVVYVEIEEEV